MYSETVLTLGDQAAAKLKMQRRSLPAHLVRSMLAGMYVGAAIVLIFTIGAQLAQDSPGLVRMTMGICFGGALTIVIFAGSELFTGSNLVLTLGVLTGKARWADKNPENVLYWRDWDRLLGRDWLFVHMVRHPLERLHSATRAGLLELCSELNPLALRWGK